MSSKKRICFFIGELGNGGAEKVISMLANFYSSKEYEVDIVMLLGTTVYDSLYHLDKRINVVSLSKTKKGYWTNSLHWIYNIRKYLKKRKPNCVVSFVGRINALVLTSSIGLKIPILVSERNDPKHDGRSKLMLAYCNFIYLRAKTIVFQSLYEKSCFSQEYDSKSYVIPNPIMIKVNNSIRVDNFLISTAGRLSPQKNHKMLIDAISVIKKEFPEVKCEIYGDGYLKESLAAQINSKELSSNVFLMGNKNNVQEYIAKSRFFVLTSNFEGLSNALMEAMCLGKVCITTDYPGARELIKDKVNGMVVPCEDHVKLAEALSLLLNNPSLSEKYANEALKDSSAFDFDVVIEKWDKAIQETISDI